MWNTETLRNKSLTSVSDVSGANTYPRNHRLPASAYPPPSLVRTFPYPLTLLTRFSLNDRGQLHSVKPLEISLCIKYFENGLTGSTPPSEDVLLTSFNKSNLHAELVIERSTRPYKEQNCSAKQSKEGKNKTCERTHKVAAKVNHSRPRTVRNIAEVVLQKEKKKGSIT
ncbi:hypothetical protein YC2023_071138 [Brassica napus]